VKRVRPEVFILGETDGTGPGSENNYADGGSAADAAYDWNLYAQIKSTLSGGSLTDLDNRVRNFSPTLFYNYYTGTHSHYLRFLENHDETRIASLYTVPQTKAAAALLMTIPGLPLIYAGQEVGETSRRAKINWNRPGAQELFKYYQRLVHIRTSFEAFRSSEIKRIGTSHSRVYSLLRPHVDQNAIVAVNFSGSSVTAILNIIPADLRVTGDSLRAGVSYYLNDVLNDTLYTVTKSTLPTFQVALPPWGSAVFVFADTLIKFLTEVKQSVLTSLPDAFQLYPNSPNPFNPSTTIRYAVPQASHVTLKVFNLLGQEVRTLVDEVKMPGEYTVRWDGDADRKVASGVYIVAIGAGAFQKSIKALFMK